MSRVRPAAAVAALMLLAATACDPEVGGTPLDERRPFAVWPEDQPDVAAQACARRSESEPWRLAPGATARRFAAEVLGWPTPASSDPPADAPGTVVTVTDREASKRELFLGIVVGLRRLGRCWFVRSVDERELNAAATVAFIGRAGRRRALVNWDLESPARASVGYGEATTKAVPPDGQATFRISESDMNEVGHYLAWASRGTNAFAVGRPLPAPPTRVRSRAVGPEGGFAVWPSSGEGLQRRICRHPGHLRSARRAILSYVADSGYLFRGFPAHRRPRSLKPAHGSGWRLAVGRARLIVETREFLPGCWVLTSIAPEDGLRARPSVRVGPEAMTLDLEWGAAREAYVSFGSGGSYVQGWIDRVRGPITFSARPELDRPGSYEIALYDERDRLISVEAEPLGPP